MSSTGKISSDFGISTIRYHAEKSAFRCTLGGIQIVAVIMIPERSVTCEGKYDGHEHVTGQTTTHTHTHTHTPFEWFMTVWIMTFINRS